MLNYHSALETYRSGHNEPDSKSGCLHGHVGSNPTVSVLVTMDLPFGRSFFFWLGLTGRKGLGKYWQVWSGMCKQRQVEQLEVAKVEVTTLLGHLIMLKHNRRYGKICRRYFSESKYRESYIEIKGGNNRG